MHHRGEDTSVHVAGLASDQGVVEVTPPSLRREWVELQGSVAEGGYQAGVLAQRSSLLDAPGHGRWRLPGDPAVQGPSCGVGEGEGGGQGLLEGRAIALGLQDRT